MTEQRNLTERAADLRAQIAEAQAAPMLSKMALALEAVESAADLVADMAARLDQIEGGAA